VESERRRLFRHGALLLLVGALLGLVVSVPRVPHPEKWMAAHVAGLLTGILLIAIGGVWSELRLVPARRLLAVRLGLFAAWGGLAGQVFGALVDLPGPANEPGRPPVEPWHAWAFTTLIVFVVPATIGSFYLVWKGLRD
jgi:hydroxylaminobenzene mutase